MFYAINLMLVSTNEIKDKKCTFIFASNTSGFKLNFFGLLRLFVFK